MKVTLPLVTASGKREGWWFHVTGIADGKKPGFGGFLGTRLAFGVCDLPPMSVLLLIRPTGSARADGRAADVMYVSPSSGGLQGKAYGFEWTAGRSFEQLKAAVTAALEAQGNFERTERKLNDILDKWVRAGNSAQGRDALCNEVVGLVKDCVPLADDVTVEPSNEHRDQIIVTFTAHKSDPTMRRVRCAVPVYNNMGDPDFCYLLVQVPADYDNVEEDDSSEDLHHHRTARASAENLGFEVASMAPVFDDYSDEWRPLLDLFDWDTASLFGLDGKEIGGVV